MSRTQWLAAATVALAPILSSCAQPGRPAAFTQMSEIEVTKGPTGTDAETCRGQVFSREQAQALTIKGEPAPPVRMTPRFTCYVDDPGTDVQGVLTYKAIRDAATGLLIDMEMTGSGQRRRPYSPSGPR